MSDHPGTGAVATTHRWSQRRGWSPVSDHTAPPSLRTLLAEGRERAAWSTGHHLPDPLPVHVGPVTVTRDGSRWAVPRLGRPDAPPMRTRDLHWALEDAWRQAVAHGHITPRGRHAHHGGLS